MTSLLNIAGNIPVSGVEEGQSLRFEDGDSAYLSWTPASAGNQKTWTWSGWFKRGNIGTAQVLLSAPTAGGYPNLSLFFQSDDTIRFTGATAAGGGTVFFNKITTAVFRDPSAWYHIVAVADFSNTDAKLYVNGSEITSFSTNLTPSNTAGAVNSVVSHSIGQNSGIWYLDGYLANVTFIDGQALTPTSFGEYEDTLWKPKSDTAIQSLTFGTNGFYLPFKQTTEAEGFSTVTYTGNGGTQGIEGVGFEPDFVWVKNRSGRHHRLYDSVRGATKELYSSATDAEYTESNGITSFDSNGFTVGSSTGVNESSQSHVAWCWDAGTGSAVSNTDGSITSSVKANTTNGFSVVSYTSPNNSSDQTVGHGLSQAPDMIICKNRDSSYNWDIYHSGTGNVEETLTFTTAATRNVDAFTTTAPTSTVFGTKNTYTHNGTDDYIAYCFHSVSGYSDIGKWTGTGSSVSVTTGFKPAFLLLKNANDGTASWIIFDSTRSVTDPRVLRLDPDSSNAESTFTNAVDFDSNGFTINATGLSQSGDDYIYMAFADTRDATFFGDTSGNGNNWTPNKLNNTDVVLDSPVSGGNFATLNPLDKDGHTNSEGNLKVAGNVVYGHQGGTFAVTSGKWYFEAILTVQQNDTAIALKNQDADTDAHYTGQTTDSVGYLSDGRFFYNGSSTSYSSYSTGDVAQIAFDADTGEIWIGKNNTWQNSGDPAAGTGEVQTVTWNEFIPAARTASTGELVFNFGQDSSFAGNETPQGNTDDNGVGDFYYAPPSGFLALTTGNLPTPTITAPDDYFNTVLYSGNSSTQSITGVNFQPDWTWIKSRSDANSHQLYDSVRGATQRLRSDLTDSEDTKTTGLTSFDSDGFSLGLLGGSNGSGKTYVAWNWLAGGTAVSNTDGSITSQVSANTDAGCSIATYTGNGTSGATFGHGLTSSAPDMVIVKRRDSTGSWQVYVSDLGATKFLELHSSYQEQTATNRWNDTAPSSSVVTLGNNSNVNSNGGTYVAYSFASVSGYSKIGSYTGNGSTDGTYVHCGFRPAFLIVKRTDGGASWYIQDSKRDTFNESDSVVVSDGSFAEGTEQDKDFLSNGFKLRASDVGGNASGATYIFIAFAEAPFKNANAR